MKRCPKCNRQYDDETLRFCLEDGSSLFTARDSDAPATEIMPPRGGPTVRPAGQTIPSYPSAGELRPPSGEIRQTNPLLTGGVIAIALLLLALVGIAGFFVLKQSSGDSANVKRNDNANVRESTPSPGPGSSPQVKSSVDESAPTNSQSGPLKITASASSVRLAVQENTYYPANAFDGKKSTAWIEGVDGPGIGEWIRFDFDREINIHRVFIQPGYFKSASVWAQNNRLATVTAQFSDGSSRELTFADRMESQRIDVGSIKTRWVKLIIKSVYSGTDPDTALSEIAFEWE
jgi:F5/8 type C domain